MGFLIGKRLCGHAISIKGYNVFILGYSIYHTNQLSEIRVNTSQKFNGFAMGIKEVLKIYQSAQDHAKPTTPNNGQARQTTAIMYRPFQSAGAYTIQALPVPGSP